MRTIGNVRQLVSRKVVFALESGIADVADESPFDGVLNDMLLDQVSFRQSHLALGAAEENGSIQCGLLADLPGLKRKIFVSSGCGTIEATHLWSRLPFLRRLLLLRSLLRVRLFDRLLALFLNFRRH